MVHLSGVSKSPLVSIIPVQVIFAYFDGFLDFDGSNPFKDAISVTQSIIDTLTVGDIKLLIKIHCKILHHKDYRCLIVIEFSSHQQYLSNMLYLCSCIDLVVFYGCLYCLSMVSLITFLLCVETDFWIQYCFYRHQKILPFV